MIGYAVPGNNFSDRVLETDKAHRRLIDHQPRRVGGKFRAEIATRHELPAYGMTVFRGNTRGGKFSGLIGILSSPAKPAAGVPDVGDRTARRRHVFDNPGIL